MINEGIGCNATGPLVRVALLTPDLVRTPGGIATASRALAASKPLMASGVTVTVVPTHAEGKRLQKVSVAWRAATALIRSRKDFDIAHIQVSSRLSVERKAVLALVCRAIKLPYIVQVHGADSVDDWRRGSRWHRAAYTSLLRGAGAVLVLGTSVAEAMREDFDLGDHVEVFPNFVSAPAAVADLPEIPAVVAIGRLGERKGSYLLLEALEMLFKRGIQLKAQLIGDGEVVRVREVVNASPELRPRVDVLGWQSPEAVARTVDDAWCVVLPSFAEGLPMTILEGMSRGRAPIATRVGGIPDVVVHGVNGFLVDTGDVAGLAAAIEAFVSDRVRAASLGDAARQTVLRSYTEDVVGRRLAEIYRRLTLDLTEVRADE